MSWHVDDRNDNVAKDIDSRYHKNHCCFNVLKNVRKPTYLFHLKIHPYNVEQN